VLAENDAHIVPVGSAEFFEYGEGAKGKRRIVVQAKAGDTIESIGKKYLVSAATMERVNRRARNEALKESESVVVYLPAQPGGAIATQTATAQATVVGPASRIEPVPNGPLPEAPYPAGLPQLP
jgi:hypothetical protein